MTEILNTISPTEFGIHRTPPIPFQPRNRLIAKMASSHGCIVRAIIHPFRGVLPEKEGVIWENPRENEASGDDSKSRQSGRKDNNKAHTREVIVSTNGPSASTDSPSFRQHRLFRFLPFRRRANVSVLPMPVLATPPASWPEFDPSLRYFHCHCGNWHAVSPRR